MCPTSLCRSNLSEYRADSLEHSSVAQSESLYSSCPEQSRRSHPAVSGPDSAIRIPPPTDSVPLTVPELDGVDHCLRITAAKEGIRLVVHQEVSGSWIPLAPSRHVHDESIKRGQ